MNQKNLILVFLVLCSIHFWGYLPFWWRKDMTDFISLAIMGLSLISLIQDKSLRFRGAIIIFLIGVILNIFSAYLNNGQGIKDTTLSFGYYYFIVFYFWLHKSKVDIRDLERLIIAFAIIYIVLNQLQVQLFPRRLFHGTMFADRGTVRMRIEGASFATLGYFLLLNRYLLKRKLVDILIAMILLYIIIRGGSRTFAMGAIVLSGVVFIKMVKYSPLNYFLIVFAVVLFVGMLQLEEPSRIIQGMITTTEEQKEQGDRYIRIMQYNYFTEEYPQNWSYYVFGGGLPGGYGSYANRMVFMIAQYGFYWVDLGILGFFLVIGLFTTIGMLWWVFKSIFIKLPPDKFYLNIYFAYLFLVSTIVMDEIFAPGIFGVQAIALYMIDISRDEMYGNKSLTLKIDQSQ